jgi:hypothetical protein
VFESKLLSRVFEPRREEVAGGRRKLHIEELVVICNSSSYVYKVMKSRRRMRRNKYVARKDKSRNGSKTVVGREEAILSRLSDDGKVILNWALRK